MISKHDCKEAISDTMFSDSVKLIKKDLTLKLIKKVYYCPHTKI